jgi:hypothetical protein
MSDKPDGKDTIRGARARRWRIVTEIIVASFALYVLSVGPAYWVSDHLLRWSFVNAVYDPLFRFREVCPPFKSALSWYLGLFGVELADERSWFT